jgi:hypothetical protein
LSRRDADLLEILGDAKVVGVDGPRTLLEWRGKRCHLGPPAPGEACGEPLFLEHPEVRERIAECIEQTGGEGVGPGDWEVHKVRYRGLEEEERIVVVGSEPLEGTTAWPSLQAAIEAQREEIDRDQRERVERLLWQIRARRDDLERWGSQAEAALEKKIEDARKARRLASTPAAASRAKALQTRVQNELEKLRRENREEAERTLRALGEEEQRIREMRFVEVSSERLFKVDKEGSPA